MADDAPPGSGPPHDVKPRTDEPSSPLPPHRPAYPAAGLGSAHSDPTPPTESSAGTSLIGGSPTNTMQLDAHGLPLIGGEAGPSREDGSGGSVGGVGGPHEDVMALRRREANRLAAQRFRSRKKGYQDSLEERIRALEEEKDGLARRLERAGDDTRVDGRFVRPGGARRSPSSDPYARPAAYGARYDRGGPGGGSGGGGGNGARSVSPITRDGFSDGELRVAGLESANRRLQDELRGVYEENDRLRAELDRWRDWTRESRAAAAVVREPRDRDGQYHDDYLSHRDKASSRSTYHPTSPYDPPPAPLPSDRATPYPSNPPLPPPPPIAYRPGSPGIQLAPLRLPPLPGSSPSGRTALPSPQLAPPGLTYPSGPYASDRPRSGHGSSAQQQPARPSGR